MKIERLKSGSYRIRVYVGKDKDGRKHWKSITGSDKRHLQMLAAQYSNDHRTYCGETIGDLIDSYVCGKAAVLSPSTVRGYTTHARMIRRYPVAGLQASALTAQAYQRQINQWAAEGKTAKYISNLKGLIDASLRHAGYNSPPVTLPARQRPDTYDPTVDDVRRLLKAVQGTDMDAPVRLGIHGLRRSEICGLTVEDFSPDHVHVHRAVVQAAKGYATKPMPKTDLSDRYVPIDRDLYDTVVRNGYTVAVTPNSLSRSFKRVLRGAGLPDFRFHDLRHFFAAYMHDRGFSDAQIQAFGGWKTDAVMKRVYRYAMQDDGTKKRAAEALSELS